MKENLQEKEKELDLWIEEYNKQLEEKSIEGKDSEETDSKERGIEPRFIDRNTIREMLHSAEDWNAIRREKDEKEKAVASTTALYQSAEKAHQQHLEHQPAKDRDALLAIQQEYQERSQRNELIAANARMQNHQEAVKQLGDKAEALKLVTQGKGRLDSHHGCHRSRRQDAAQDSSMLYAQFPDSACQPGNQKVQQPLRTAAGKAFAGHPSHRPRPCRRYPRHHLPIRWRNLYRESRSRLRLVGIILPQHLLRESVHRRRLRNPRPRYPSHRHRLPRHAAKFARQEGGRHQSYRHDERAHHHPDKNYQEWQLRQQPYRNLSLTHRNYTFIK